ncbi:MAG TPA: diphthamide biosynthesis enzyme Dph2 [Thermoplasmatales archaeon]|nr:diphthamide biosynthesis enzyme Dph2 [Thermoplasmatales archaeon]
MKLKYYEIDEKKLLEEVEGKNVSIKLPDGLKPYATKLLNFLEENGKEAIFMADSCYGACDFIYTEDIEKTIFIGETEMPFLKKIYGNKISFIEAKYNFNEEFLRNAFPFIKGKKIGLISISPFIHKINDCKKFLEENGYKVFIGKRGRRTAYDGQILGCDFSPATSIADKTDEFLFIGDGFFHPVGLYMATKKRVVCANPIDRRVYADEIKKIAEKIARQRYANIAKAMEAEKFGVIATQKVGQKRLRLAKKLREFIKIKGKKAYLIILNEIDERINYLDFDCYVSTACPRVAIDDAERYKKPILTPIELEILFEERKWENYEFDQIL